MLIFVGIVGRGTMGRLSSFGFFLLSCALALHVSTANAACDDQRAEYARNALSIQALDRGTRPATDAAAAQYLVQRQTLTARQAALRQVLDRQICLPNPPPPSGAPDIVMQWWFCLPAGGVDQEELDGYFASALANAHQNDPDLFPAPSELSGCDNGLETVGIWREAAGQPAGLANIDIMPPATAFAIQMSAAAANTLVGEEWAAYKAKNAEPDRTYNGYDIAYDTSKSRVTVSLHATGTYKGQSIGDVTIGLIDDLSTVSGAPSCTHNATYNYNMDAAAALLGFFMPMPIGGGFISYIQSDFASQGSSIMNDPDLQDSGLGCEFAALVPTTILVGAVPKATPPRPPGKYVMGYRSVSASSASGMTFYSGQFTDAPTWQKRNPAILQLQPFLVHIYQRDAAATTISARLEVATRDLRAPGTNLVPVKWSTTAGKIVAIQSNGQYALVDFGSLPADRRSVGMTTTLGSVTVSAVDIDGVTASATYGVAAVVTGDPPPPPPKSNKKLQIISP